MNCIKIPPEFPSLGTLPMPTRELWDDPRPPQTEEGGSAKSDALERIAVRLYERRYRKPWEEASNGARNEARKDAVFITADLQDVGGPPLGVKLVSLHLPEVGYFLVAAGGALAFSKELAGIILACAGVLMFYRTRAPG